MHTPPRWEPRLPQLRRERKGNQLLEQGSATGATHIAESDKQVNLIYKLQCLCKEWSKPRCQKALSFLKAILDPEAEFRVSLLVSGNNNIEEDLSLTRTTKHKALWLHGNIYGGYVV